MLSTENQRREYTAKGEKHVAKFMPRFDSPYYIINVNWEKSTVTLDFPQVSKRFLTFHTGEVMPYSENDCALFPDHELARPGAIITKNGAEEYYIKKIIDAHKQGRRGMQYLVR
ncbi:hypothetical protein L208DRAFT_1496046 [Tricholoma matsutake]|nr:hypothetical protein L208DRAFT_1496046 [Tricholoma matsutake 945]